MPNTVPCRIKIKIGTSGQSRKIELDRFVMGRSMECTVILDSPEVSRKHLEVEIRDEQVWITDLKSSNGTYYQHRRIMPDLAVLYTGGEVRLGGMSKGAYLEFELDIEEKTADHPIPVRAMPVQAEPAIERSKSYRTSGTRNSLPGATPPESSRAELRPTETPPIESNPQLTRSHAALRLPPSRTSVSRVSEVPLAAPQSEAFDPELSARLQEKAKLLDIIGGLRDAQVIAERDLKEIEESHMLIVQEHEIKINSLQDDRILLENEIASRQHELELISQSLQEKRAEVHSQDQELDGFKRKLETERRFLEAESSLRQMQIQNEFEKSKSEKILFEREIGIIKEELAQLEIALRLKKEKHEGIQADIQALQEELLKEKGRVDSLKRNQSLIEASIESAKLTQTEELTRKLRTEQETKKLSEDALVELQLQKKAHQEELDRRTAESQAECARMIQSAQEKIDHQKTTWESEYSTLKIKAIEDYKSEAKRWGEDLASLRQRETQELKIWQQDEERRVQTLLAQDLGAFIHSVSSNTVIDLKSITSDERLLGQLSNSLEKSLRRAFSQEAAQVPAFNPQRKANTRKFWKKVGVGTAAVIFGALGTQWIGGMVKQTLDRKIANHEFAAPSDEFLKRIRDARKRSMTLELKQDREFRTTYLDNVLYNVGYGEMKQDDKLQKEWIVVVNRFLLNQLKLSESAVVQFIPLEASMIREFAEQRHILNQNNVKVLVEQMRKTEAAKREAMIKLVGGKANFENLRTLEKGFYLKTTQGL